MLRTAGILVVVISLGLTAASVASAAPRAYGGTTITAWPVVMNTTADGKRVTKIGAYWNGRCDSGNASGKTFSYGRITSGRAIRGSRVTRGKFSLSTRQNKDLGDGRIAVVTQKVKGSLSKTGATGKWHGHVVVKDASARTVDTCDTGDVSWSLFRNPYVYIGQTASPQAQPVVLRVDKTRSKVTGFWTSYLAPCEGADTPLYESVDLFDVKVSGTGTIDDVTTADQDRSGGGKDSRRWTTKGSIGTSGATGTFAFHEEQTNASGEVVSTCDLPALTWNASTG